MINALTTWCTGKLPLTQWLINTRTLMGPQMLIQATPNKGWPPESSALTLPCFPCRMHLGPGGGEPGVGSGPPPILPCEDKLMLSNCRASAQGHLEAIRPNCCHFTDGDTKPQGGAGTCPRSQSKKETELGLDSMPEPVPPHSSVSQPLMQNCVPVTEPHKQWQTTQQGHGPKPDCRHMGGAFGEGSDLLFNSTPSPPALVLIQSRA